MVEKTMDMNPAKSKMQQHIQQKMPQQKQQVQQQQQTQQIQQQQIMAGTAGKEANLTAALEKLTSLMENQSLVLEKILETLQKIEIKSGISKGSFTEQQFQDVFKNPQSYHFDFMESMTIGDLIRKKLDEGIVTAEKFCGRIGLSQEQYVFFLNDDFLPEPRLSTKMAKLLKVTLSDVNVCRANTYDKIQLMQSPEWKEESLKLGITLKFRSVLKDYCGKDAKLLRILGRNCSDYLDTQTMPEEELNKANEMREQGLEKLGIGYVVKTHLWKAVRLALTKGDTVKTKTTANILKGFLEEVLEPDDEEIQEVNLILSDPVKCATIVKKAKEDYVNL